MVDLSYPTSQERRGRVQGGGQISPTLTTESIPSVIEFGDENKFSFIYEIDGVYYRIRIRKLTPRECWRLMGFTDEDFERAAYDIKSIKEDILCSARLKDMIEKRSQKDTETYALNITNALQEQGITSTEWMQYQSEQEQGKSQYVNIALKVLGKTERKECAINIIKCLENMETLYTLMKELDQHHMAIIELEEKGKRNTERYMKITLEENLSLEKLYTILTVIEPIIELKIFTCTLQQVNIQGHIVSSVDLLKNMEVSISNLKMEGMYTRVSQSQLYKEASNSIVKNVLMAIFGQMIGEQDA